MSRELDAEIAEKVIGLEWWTSLGCSYLLRPHEVEEAAQKYGWKKGKSGRENDIEGSTLTYGGDGTLDRNGRGRFYVPHFSTEIQAAFEVVKAMASKGWGMTLMTRGGQNPCDHCFGVKMPRVYFYESKYDQERQWWNTKREVEAEANTVEEAICRAALEAMKVEA